MRTAILLAALAVSVMGQHVVESNTGRTIGRGDKVQVGQTYKVNFTPPEGCVLVTRIAYGLRTREGRWIPGPNTAFPWVCPVNVYRSVGYRCPGQEGITWVQDTFHSVHP